MSDTQDSVEKHGRRSFLLMGLGLGLSYGLLALQGLAFLVPRHLKTPTRRIFMGLLSRFPMGGVVTVSDLQGNDVLIQNRKEGLRAYSSVCPHLGCRVHYEAEGRRFFCPCHGGVFNLDGVAIAGPPKDAGQSLGRVPVTVDQDSGVVYLEVAEAKEDNR